MTKNLLYLEWKSFRSRCYETRPLLMSKRNAKKEIVEKSEK